MKKVIKLMGMTLVVVLIALVLIFKDEMIEIVESIFKTINKRIDKI